MVLLSATPYEDLSLDHEEDDHYADFLNTIHFLLGNDAGMTAVQDEIATFRRELLTLDPERSETLKQSRDALTSRLRSVMCRTERVAHTQRQNAMLSEPSRPAPLQAADLHQADLVIGASRRVGAHGAVEYWKSAPYPLEFHEGLRAAHEDRRPGRV